MSLKVAGSRNTEILDLPGQLRDSYHNGFTPEFHGSDKQVATSYPAPQPFWTLTRDRWYSRSRLTITDAEDAQLAKWHSPVMSYGAPCITFPEHSPHCSHPHNVQPVNIGRRAQSFMKDSSMYLWEAQKRFKSGCISLYKIVAAEKLEVTRYESDTRGFISGGPLDWSLETGEVDELVVLQLVWPY
jgi:hypothetical protein